jgi:hypothetical protein
MTTARQQRINELRQRQPLAELERKWNKVKDSRHARRYWTVEWLDLASARAEGLHFNIDEGDTT